MRTTFTLDPDVASAVQRLRREEGIGISEAVNRLIRSGLARKPGRAPYQHHTVKMGMKMDVSDIGAVLDLLDQD
jgi:hypothetical protein